MFINESKTKYMIQAGKRLRKRLPSHTELFVSISESNIEQEQTHRVIGITIDQDLLFEDHIDELSKNIRKIIGVLRQISSYLRKYQREMYYVLWVIGDCA
jgi:uncharacterized protein (UPF0371 family)